MRANLNQTAFTGGEWSPRAHGRTDFDRYASALKRCENAFPVIQGGVRRRPGFQNLLPALSDTADATILLPFWAGRDAAYMLEFGNLTCRVLNADGTSAGVTLTSPYSSSNLALLDWAQADSTMWLFHPNFNIRRLQLLDGPSWALSIAPITQLPFGEAGFLAAADGTLSAATVGVGRTLTASAATFLASDVGRAVLYQAGIAVITAYTSTTQVTVEITRAFPSTALPADAWTVDSSPQTDCTPGADGPVGATTTLTLAAAGWRTTDVGSIVRINGGLLRVSAYTSATIVSGVILKELAATVAAPALAWSLEPALWSSARGFPRTGTIHQQRLIAAGTRTYPRTVWGSRLGETLDFTFGTDDDDAFSFTMDGDEASPIAFVSSNKDLAVFTESAEVTMRSGIEKPLTPTNVRVISDSNHGSAAVRPITVGREVMFVQRGGVRVRSYGYRYDFDGYSAPDMTALAEHLSRRGITWLAFQQLPDPLVWAACADGTLLSCTFDRDQQPAVVGWAQHETDGFVECVATIPDDDTEWLWAIVRRTVNGATKRYIERLNDRFEPIHPSVLTGGPVYGFTVDNGTVFDNAAGQSTFSVPHLAGCEVDVVADGVKLSRETVDAAGGVTIDRAGKRVLIGLPFTSTITLLPPEFGTAMGSSQAQSARTGQLTIRFLETIGARITSSTGSSQTLPFQTFGPGVLDQAAQPFTGLYAATLLGWDKGNAEVSILQEQPYPMHVLAVIRRYTVNGG